MKALLTIVMLFFCFNASSSVKKEIYAWCDKYDYSDCNLVKTVIEKESNWKPKAFNTEGSQSNGSYGLMQIRCSTAKNLGLKYSCEQLFNPQINVRFGIKYLKWLEEKLETDASIPSLFAGYNAGLEYDKKRKEYKPKRCKNYNSFRFHNSPRTECFPGEYINEWYVWKAVRKYNFIKEECKKDLRCKQRGESRRKTHLAQKK